MFGWFRKPKYSETDMLNAITHSMDYSATMFNAAGTLSWKDLFGNYHPRDLKNQNNQMGLAAIFCAVNMYSGAILSVPRFCQKIDPENNKPIRFVQTTDHPAARIWMHYATDDLDSDEMLKRMILNILFTDGNYYALPEYDSQRRIFRSHYIHPSRIPPGNIYYSPGKETLSSGRKTRPGELVYKILSHPDRETENPEYMLLTSKQIMHMRGLISDPDNHRSMGILENNLRSSELYEAAEQMGTNFYKYGYQNQMMLTTEAKLDSKVRKNLEDKINNRGTSGLPIEEIFKTKILEQGLKPVHVGMPMNAIQFIETRAFSVEDVGRWFNISPSLLHSVMGTGTTPPDYDQQMTMWIQNGLGHFMNNLARQFRNTHLPRSSHPLFKFDFQRFHLYKTVLNDFSQALRNFFETGVLNRLEIAEMVGNYLDPTDPTNTIRYVPANLVTVDHSLALQKKAEMSLDVMEQDLEASKQETEFKKENHDIMKERMKQEAESGDAHDKGEGDGDEDKLTGATDPQKDQDESNQDKKTRPVPSLNLVKTALFNSLELLHQHEIKVLEQKQKSRPDNLVNAMMEWQPKFINKLTTELDRWGPDVLNAVGLQDRDHVIDVWTEQSRVAWNEKNPPEVMEDNFNSLTSALQDKTDDSE